jgi:hypothetical protein
MPRPADLWKLCVVGAATMFVSELKRRIAGAFAVVALCAATAGCAVDVGNTRSDGSGSSNQLRYYGGPKSPMWTGQ